MVKRKRVYVPRRRKRRRRYKRSRPTVSRNLGPLKVKQKAKLIYHETFGLNPGVAGVPATHVFSANGVFDPNITGGGHQPRGLDQLFQLYDHCVVIATKAFVWCQNTDATQGQTISMFVKDGTAVPADPNEIYEMRFIKMKELAPRDGGISGKSLSIACNPNKFLGRSKPLSDSDLKNSSTSNPSEQAYIHVNATTMGNNDGATLHCRIRLEYTCVFIEPKQPAES